MKSVTSNRHRRFTGAVPLVGLLVGLSAAAVPIDKGSFSAAFQRDEEHVVLTGDSDYHMTGSSLTIYLRSDEGRCGIHFVNFETAPSLGTHEVGSRDQMNAGVICVLENTKQRERLTSESGTITLKERLLERVEGELDVVMLGGLTRKAYRLTGEFSSVR
jgi:hypothetical protein